MTALTLVAACAALANWRKPLLAQVQALYWQHRCLNYQQPREHVAFEDVDGGAPASELAAHAARISAGYCGWDEIAYDPAEPLDRLRRLTAPSAPSQPGLPPVCVFMHERRSPGGHDRLVVVESEFCVFLHGGSSERFCLSGTSIKPAGMMSWPRSCPDGKETCLVKFADVESPSQSARFLRFFSGAVDPANPSHFTIDYQANAIDLKRLRVDPSTSPIVVQGVINGWLQDDDTVRLKVRNAPPAKFDQWVLLNDPSGAPTVAPEPFGLW